MHSHQSHWSRLRLPALKGEQFCYFHQNAHRSVRRPKQSRLHPIALIEDEESIQYALMEVINALMKNTIDLKRATLILRALHIAVKNAGRVKFEVQGIDAVTMIPDFAPPPDNADFDETTEIDLPYNAWVPPKTERQVTEEKARAQKLREWRDPQAAIRANLERARIPTEKRTATTDQQSPATTHVATAASAVQAKSSNVGTAAPGCPGREATANVGADPLVRPASGASVPAVDSATPLSPAATVPPHNFKPPQPAQPAAKNSAPTRKPPQPAAPVPKDRKNATHASRHG